MDLNTIEEIRQPKGRAELGAFGISDAWLAGGTWIYSEPQPHLRRLTDLSRLGWEPLSVSENGIFISATCTIAALEKLEAPPTWIAADLIGKCCQSFLASFKICNTATVGGNLCLALPAGPMISLCAALEGVCTIWTPDGETRLLPVVDFIAGPMRNALRQGELLRGVSIPAEALTRRSAFRRISLSPHGRSAALLIGTLSSTGDFRLTVTAATKRPVVLAFEKMPAMNELESRLNAGIPFDLYYDDIHGRPEWRWHMTFEFAREIRSEMAGIRP